MENDYGVGVSNRYGLFLEEEEEDPFDLLSKQEQLKDKKKKPTTGGVAKPAGQQQQQEKENRSGKPQDGPKSKPPPAAGAAKKPIKETQNLKPLDKPPREEKPRAPAPASAGPRNPSSVKFAPESREERNNRRNRDDQSRSYSGEGGAGGDPEQRGGGRGRGGPGRGGGRGRGGSFRGGPGGGTGGGEFRPRREFDRHSGSDKSSVKPVDKREGGGARNWGTYRDEINETMTEPTEQLTPEKPAAEPHTEDSPGETKDEHPADENAATEDNSAKELTLDEWKALRGSHQKPTFNIRKAGEGEDPSQWKKMYELNRKGEAEDDEEDDEYELAEYPQRVGRQKHVLDIDIHFSDARRGGRGRGGGRGGRGGRGGPGGSAGGGGGPPGSGPGGPRREGREGPPSVPEGGAPRGAPGGGGFPKPPGRGAFRQQQSAPKVDDEKDFPSLG